jgi:hypothetical protein
MCRPDKISIAIITFHNDFELLKKLLNSIYAYWDPVEIDSIKIVLNDGPEYYSQFNELIDEVTVPDFKIDKVFHYELAPKVFLLNWTSQQLFKCVISKKITTEWYLINDCKDTYNAPTGITDCFTQDGKAIMHLDHNRYTDQNEPMTHWGFGPFSSAFRNSCLLFNVDPEDCKNYHLPFLTPFLVKTSMMQDMVQDVKSMMQGMFPFLFAINLDGAFFVTEFLLYNAYCYSKNKLTDYADWEINYRKFFSSVSQSIEQRSTTGVRIMDFSRNE